MVRFLVLWLGLHPFPDAQTPSRSRGEQVHLVRFDLQRLRLHPQPDREA